MTLQEFKLPPGFFDILPLSKDLWKDSSLWNFIEKNINSMAELYALKEIRAPIVESAKLFERTSGETCEICDKEMYRFLDRSNRMLCLRPEGTAGVLRAFSESNLLSEGDYHRLFYYGPMFRYDRPQKGRYRQHHQFGVEILGSNLPEQDSELISMLMHFYKNVGITDLKVHVNTLGSFDERSSYLKILKEYFQDLKEKLSPLSQKRLETNPLRILDSKEAEDQTIVLEAPSILQHLSTASKERFERILDLLVALNIPYQQDDKLVRGLDYYCHTVFEIKSGSLGAQNSLGGGGRYDGLLSQIGGKDLPGIGFATGIERVIIALLELSVPPLKSYPCQLYMIALGEREKLKALAIIEELRQKGFKVQLQMVDRKLKKALSVANMLKAEYVAILGEEELASKRLTLKNMASKSQTSVSFDKLSEYLQ